MKTLMILLTIVVAIPVGLATFIACLLVIQPAKMGHNVSVRFGRWLEDD